MASGISGDVCQLAAAEIAKIRSINIEHGKLTYLMEINQKQNTCRSPSFIHSTEPDPFSS